MELLWPVHPKMAGARLATAMSVKPIQQHSTSLIFNDPTVEIATCRNLWTVRRLNNPPLITARSLDSAQKKKKKTSVSAHWLPDWFAPAEPTRSLDSSAGVVGRRRTRRVSGTSRLGPNRFRPFRTFHQNLSLSLRLQPRQSLKRERYVTVRRGCNCLKRRRTVVVVLTSLIGLSTLSFTSRQNLRIRVFFFFFFFRSEGKWRRALKANFRFHLQGTWDYLVCDDLDANSVLMNWNDIRSPISICEFP